MFAFMYIAYSIMALFYETVPAFEDTWIECLAMLIHTIEKWQPFRKDDLSHRSMWSVGCEILVQQSANP